jgi:hypothetical protein
MSGGPLTFPNLALTSSFGFFTFQDIEVEQTYVISVASKRFGFAEPNRAITVVDNIVDLTFTPSWQN